MSSVAPEINPSYSEDIAPPAERSKCSTAYSVSNKYLFPMLVIYLNSVEAKLSGELLF